MPLIELAIETVNEIGRLLGTRRARVDHTHEILVSVRDTHSVVEAWSHCTTRRTTHDRLYRLDSNYCCDLPSNGEKLNWWIGNCTTKHSLTFVFILGKLENMKEPRVLLYGRWLAEDEWDAHSLVAGSSGHCVTIRQPFVLCDKENVACQQLESPRWPTESRQLMYVHFTWTYPLPIIHQWAPYAAQCPHNTAVHIQSALKLYRLFSMLL